jgi:plasmid stabilization system protein ParE
MNIRVTEDAADDLENLRARIGIDDGAAAERVIEQIRSTIRLLGELPHLGHDEIVGGTHERTVSRTPYVVVYRIDLGSKDELIILRVPRSSQQRSRYHY